MDQQQTETTLAITQAMADEITDYLMGDNLYRQLIVKTPGGVRQPKMTISALLENMETLEWERERKGYREGWASHKFREKFGVWPNAVKHQAAIEPDQEFKNYITHLRIKWVKSKQTESRQQADGRGYSTASASA